MFDNDIFQVTYTDFHAIPVVYDDSKIYVTLMCDNVSELNPGDNLRLSFDTYKCESGIMVGYGDSANVVVDSVDRLENTICFIDDRYTTIIPTKIIQYRDENITYWEFTFATFHYFNINDNIVLNLTYNNTNTVVLTNVKYVDDYRLIWDYDASVDGIDDLANLIFSDVGFVDIANGNVGIVNITREHIRWNSYFVGLPTYVTKRKYNVKIDIPFSLKTSNDLYQESNIKEYFVGYEQEKAVNAPIEMEKHVYTPVVVKTRGVETYEDCVKINFNLHFRTHSGDDWTVNNTDSWNFEKYGDNDNWNNNKYYSYAQTGSTPENKWNRSCQSDLLEYLGFVTNDVKYQKNKLKKSFIRLTFYDSDDSGSQNLLGYSTVFVDCNKLYSKFISRSNFECYFDDRGDIVKGIKVEREVNTGTRYSDGSLMNILDVSRMNKEEIEDYRLSSQITVKNKYLSDNSSEGFYIYTWELSDTPTLPTDVYMKVEFNHAGYGRNIPMMAPYKDNGSGFKTNNDIIDDWTTGGGYGIKKYTRYSYIHLKAKYDIKTKRHIYYLDPDTYGINPMADGNVININLYEARINFS